MTNEAKLVNTSVTWSTNPVPGYSPLGDPPRNLESQILRCFPIRAGTQRETTNHQNRPLGHDGP